VDSTEASCRLFWEISLGVGCSSLFTRLWIMAMRKWLPHEQVTHRHLFFLMVLYHLGYLCWLCIRLITSELDTKAQSWKLVRWWRWWSMCIINQGLLGSSMGIFRDCWRNAPVERWLGYCMRNLIHRGKILWSCIEHNSNNTNKSIVSFLFGCSKINEKCSHISQFF